MGDESKEQAGAMTPKEKHALALIGHELLTQDGQCTTDPVFVVQQRKRDYGYDPQFSDDGDIVWLNEGYEVDEDEWKKLEAKYEETGDEPDDHYRTAYKDRWEAVTVFFTDKAARKYIEANAHRMTNPRVYVDSAYRNKEWQMIRMFLMNLAREAL